MRLLAAPVPHRVALAWRLDLDDLGAEVAEQLAAERPGEQLPHLDHADAREPVVSHRRSPSPFRSPRDRPAGAQSADRKSHRSLTAAQMLNHHRSWCLAAAAYWSGGSGSLSGRGADQACRGPPPADPPPAVSWAIRPGAALAGRPVCDRPAGRRRGVVLGGGRAGRDQGDLGLVAEPAADRAVPVVSLLRLAGPAVRADAGRGAGRRRGYRGPGPGAAAPGPGRPDQGRHDLDAPAGVHVGVHPADRAPAVARPASGRDRRRRRTGSAPATWPMAGCSAWRRWSRPGWWR